MKTRYNPIINPDNPHWPQVIVFEAENAQQAQLPPVRIFLGTEHAQRKAQRVFIYSVEKFRNPARRYEIYCMDDLAGFDNKRWRTGFTLYRFAIPEFAGFQGKAIYNDVDQIYLADPGDLFDSEMGTAGYMSVARNDTSVMLIDCAKMGSLWNIQQAASKTKKQLHDCVLGDESCWAACDGGWNTRDCEHPLEQIKCLHYTALHTQPWRPTPEQYSYHHHTLAYLWEDLECELDALESPHDNSYENFTPVIWALTTHRRGDNSQIMNLASQLSDHVIEKSLSFNISNHIPNYLRANTLLGLKSKGILNSPWPDIVISAGRRSAPVARWIKSQSPNTRLIHIGRPWCGLSHFDLVVTTPQYQIPLRENVYINSLTLNQLVFESGDTIPESEVVTQIGMSQPYLTVVLGGHSRPYKMTPSYLSEMAQMINSFARLHNFSVLITTSPRTPSYALECFASQLDVPYQCHVWSADKKNPYTDFARLAQVIVVTGDSASMVSELCKLGKPVYVRKLPRYFDIIIDAISGLRNFCRFPLGRGNYRGMPKQQNILSRLFDKAVEYGFITSLRDLDLFLNNLQNRGYIKYLEDAESFENCQVTRNADIEIERLVAFIKKQMVER
jgi:mitochondrial fission protein ELM1